MGGSDVVLVTGASGLVGRAVADGLLARGARVRAMSRRSSSAGLPAGAEAVDADLRDPAGWDDALRDVTAVFLYPRGHTSGFLGRAALAGVERVVTLSSATVTVRERHPSPVADEHAAVESAAEASGLAAVHVRPVPFDANTLSWAPAVRGSGEVRLAHPRARYASVHEADVAAVAVADLLDPPPGGTVRQVTGPEHLTRLDQVETVARLTGGSLRVTGVAPDVAFRELIAAGTPEPVAATVIEHMARAVADPDPVTDTVRRVTGRAARSYADWVRDNLHAFRPGRIRNGTENTENGERS